MEMNFGYRFATRKRLIVQLILIIFTNMHMYHVHTCILLVSIEKSYTKLISSFIGAIN